MPVARPEEPQQPRHVAPGPGRPRRRPAALRACADDHGEGTRFVPGMKLLPSAFSCARWRAPTTISSFGLLPVSRPDQTGPEQCESSAGDSSDARRLAKEIRETIATFAHERNGITKNGGPGRTRTSNQTVMSGPVSPESSIRIDVFRRVCARSFASVHAVSVVHLWSVRPFPQAIGKGPSASGSGRECALDPTRRPALLSKVRANEIEHHHYEARAEHEPTRPDRIEVERTL
jgi:hypothetical protein